MGARVGAVCYPDAATAADAFYSAHSQTWAYVGGSNYIISYSKGSGGNWYYRVQLMNGQPVLTAEYQLVTPNFPACTPTDAAFDYVAAAAIFSFFFSFVVGVWFFSKNIGMVIEAVRKW